MHKLEVPLAALCNRKVRAVSNYNCCIKQSCTNKLPLQRVDDYSHHDSNSYVPRCASFLDAIQRVLGINSFTSQASSDPFLHSSYTLIKLNAGAH